MTLAIYDNMQNYAAELARYLAQKNEDIRTAVFFEVSQLSAWCGRERVDVLLAAETLLDDALLAVPAGQLVLLTEEEASLQRAGGRTGYDARAGSAWSGAENGAGNGTAAAGSHGKAAADALPRISRYQSADEILAEILLLCSPSAADKPQAASDTGAVFTVFYAPVPCPEQTDAAWRYTADRSCGQRVLYLNMHENAGFAERFGRDYRRDFSDLLYLSMHRSGGFSLLLRSVLCEDEGISYVPPPEQAADLFQVTERDWSTFLEMLRSESGFDEIVFDLGFLFPAAYGILEMSGTIYLPLPQTGGTTDGLRHFLRVYEKRFGSEAMKKLRETGVPETGQVN